ncbi:MAG: glycosyltransferase family 39 protein, partial [Anaerolineales bacterium]|nr:glycosyltransferase family 39 protein [Anaerolineales bacterium]
MEIGDWRFGEYRQSTPGWWQRLTVADGLLLLIGIAAAILRLTNLSSLPLSPTEAEAALGVWQLWQPGVTAVSIHSPAYFTLTALLTQILGDGEAIMRLVPALFGVGIVFLPWLLRKRLGQIGMLVTSLLLAVSPLGTAAARTASGDSMALFALLLLFAAWLRYEDSTGAVGTETGDTRWLYVAMSALALGLTSSHLFYGGLITLLLAWRWNLS